jgi:mycothiol system anti-sigma-R factor
MRRCNQIAALLYDFLDRELNESELLEVQEHLERCPPCRHIFTFEENVLRRVGECARRVSAPPALVERVRKMCDQGTR